MGREGIEKGKLCCSCVEVQCLRLRGETEVKSTRWSANDTKEETGQRVGHTP